MIRAKEKLRVKNGILLTMNPTEHTGWIIVDTGRMTQAHISAVTMARAVAALPKRRNTKYAFPTSVSSNWIHLDWNTSSVKKYILTKKAPGSVTCAHTNNNTTHTVIRMKMPFKTNLNRLSCSIWLNSIG